MQGNQTLPSAGNADPAVVKYHGPTPGPWQVTSDFVGPLRVQDARGNDIAHVGHDSSFEICSANADLIAAAPNMLAALKLSQSILEQLVKPNMATLASHIYWQATAAEVAARAAIRKATGAA